MAEEWTFGTFMKLMDAKFSKVHAILRERQKAVDLAFSNFKTWMKGTNEWRGTFEDLLKTRVSQESFDALAARVKRLEDAETKSGGKQAGLSQLGTIAATSIGTAAAMVAIFATIYGAR